VADPHIATRAEGTAKLYEHTETHLQLAFEDEYTPRSLPFHIPLAARQGDLREIMALTTCSFPQAYLLVDVGPDGTTVRFVPLTEYERSRDAYATRMSMVTVSRGLTGMASIRLANFPLVEE